MFDRSIALARFRVWAHRVQLARWLTASVCAACAAWLVATAVHDAERAAARFGDHREVVVITRDIPVGAPIGAEDLMLDRRPAGFVAEAALDAAPTDAVARRPLVAGQVLVTRDIGLAAPTGLESIGLPHDPTLLRLVVGDRVSLYAVTIGATEAAPIAGGVTVLDTSDRGIVVGATPEVAAVVAWSLVNGSITVARVD